MRRYMPLFFITAVILAILVSINLYWMHRSVDDAADKPQVRVTVYTTLPAEVVSPIAAEYERLNKVRVGFVILSPQALLAKVEKNDDPLNGQADVLLSGKAILQTAAARRALIASPSEQEDVVGKNFKGKDCLWVGVWYDPIIFCFNRDYLNNVDYIPRTWADLAAPGAIRLSITDFMASQTAANLFYALVEHFGENRAFEIIEKLHPKVVQYAKYLSTPVRMAGMGEDDISIALQSETIRYANAGYPVSIVYPEDGTYAVLTGAALLKNAPNKAEGSRFLQWLLGEDAQLCLQKNGFFFVPTNHTILAYKMYAGKNIKLFHYEPLQLSPDERTRLLNKWITTVRLK